MRRSSSSASDSSCCRASRCASSRTRTSRSVPWKRSLNQVTTWREFTTSHPASPTNVDSHGCLPIRTVTLYSFDELLNTTHKGDAHGESHDVYECQGTPRRDSRQSHEGPRRRHREPARSRRRRADLGRGAVEHARDAAPFALTSQRREAPVRGGRRPSAERAPADRRSAPRRTRIWPRNESRQRGTRPASNGGRNRGTRCFIRTSSKIYSGGWGPTEERANGSSTSSRR
jgi:hypothetical protein